ncbi:MAG: sensor domain-containing diguanylate cyclase [Candidatus Ratteibacteria bacterium]
MRLLKNIAYILVAGFLIYLNLALFTENYYPQYIYLVFLDLILAVLIVIEVVSQVVADSHIKVRQKEIAKLRFALVNASIESSIFRALVALIETFGEELTLEETLEKVAGAVKMLFQQEIVCVQIFHDRFFRTIQGGNVDLPLDFFEEVVLKGYPLLVNNTQTYEKYSFPQDSITSFLISPFRKKEQTIGLIGVFSEQSRAFTQRDLSLLNMISAPVSLIVENAELIEKTKILSITDSLTQLYNRRHFQNLLDRILYSSQETKTTVSLSIVDIDHFKLYNDRNGHLAGDKIIKEVGGLLKKHVKGTDVVARFGGEEYVIIFPATESENAMRVCEQLRKNIEETFFPDEHLQPGGTLTASFGVASLSSEEQKNIVNVSEVLIHRADEALYASKREGRNRVTLAHPSCQS